MLTTKCVLELVFVFIMSTITMMCLVCLFVGVAAVATITTCLVCYLCVIYCSWAGISPEYAL